MKLKKLLQLILIPITILIGTVFWFVNFSFNGRCDFSQINVNDLSYNNDLEYKGISPPRLKFKSEEEFKASNFYILKLRIRDNGTIKCYRILERKNYEDFNKQKELLNPTPALQEIIKNLSKWRIPTENGNGLNTNQIITLPIWSEVAAHQLKSSYSYGNAQYEIKVWRGDCIGNCPSYRVSLNSDGKGQFEGFSRVRKIGKVDFRIQQQFMQIIFNHINENNLWELNKDYGKAPIDTQSVLVTIITGNKKNEIYHPKIMENEIPYSVIQLEDIIDEIPQVKELIGPRSEFDYK